MLKLCWNSFRAIWAVSYGWFLKLLPNSNSHSKVQYSKTRELRTGRDPPFLGQCPSECHSFEFQKCFWNLSPPLTLVATAFCRAKWDRLPESGSSWYKQYGGACNVLKSGWFNSPCWGSCSSSRSPGTWWCPGGRASPPVPVPRLKFHCALRDSDVNNIFTLAQSSLTKAMLPEMQARWTLDRGGAKVWRDRERLWSNPEQPAFSL